MRTISLLSFCFPLFFHISAIAQDSPDFFEVDQVQEIEIQFESKNWQYLLDSLRVNGEEMLEASIQINDLTFPKSGVRFGYSRSFQPGQVQNSLEIDLGWSDPSQQYQGHRWIKLSNSLRDPSRVREVLAYEIARSYMPAPRANFAKVLINEAYYGLLINIEPFDKNFLQTHFGTATGALIQSVPGLDPMVPEECKKTGFGSLQEEDDPSCFQRHFKLISIQGWEDLGNLVRVLNQEPEKIESVLHVDRTLWMLAFNNVLVNLYSYTGQHSPNFYLYQDSKGVFHPILGDLNLAFGSFKNTGKGSDLKPKSLIELDPLLHADDPNKPLISRLLANDLYRRIYLSHLRTILYEYFVSGKYEARAKAMQELIKTPYLTDRSHPYTSEEFLTSLYTTIGKQSRIPGIVELMAERAGYLKRHPELMVIPPEVTRIEVIGREKFSSQLVEDFNVQAQVDKLPKRVFLYYRFPGEEDFRQMEMFDDGNNNDKEAGDSIFGATVKPPFGVRKLEFYLFAENARSASFHPAHYMYVRHEADLDVLNQ